MNANIKRQSGVELLKIIAMLLIVISHVTQTLGTVNTYIPIQNYFIELGVASNDIQIIILNIFRQFGHLGNTIFFIASAWFFVGKKEVQKEKAFYLICTIWFISVSFLLGYLIFSPYKLNFGIIIRSLFPTCALNNWYMTCYIIFLFIFPWINKLIDQISQKQHLRIVFFTSFLWIICDYIYSKCFFPSSIILWITIFFLVSYIKLYCCKLVSSKTIGIALLLIGIIGFISQVVITNYIGLHFNMVKNLVLYWNVSNSPFNILIAIGSLIISLQATYNSTVINYISKHSLLVYLIHDNIIFRAYSRSSIWQYLYERINFSNIVIIDLTYSIILFCVSLLISTLLKKAFQKRINIFIKKLYVSLSDIYIKIENLITNSSRK